MRANEIQSRKLVIFDIDDTLVHTQTKVQVVKDGRAIKALNSHDFTHYKLQPGESFDFENFRNAREFFHNSKPIIPMMNQLKQDIATGNKVVMVTARADFDDRELFLDTFRKYGVDMNKVHVYRAGNMTGKIQTEEKKKIIIRKLLDQGQYTKAIMYDDAVPNLESFVELKDEYPRTKFYAWHVSLEGEAGEYHRTNESYTLEERKKKRKPRNAAYGPGLYGGYGYFSTYGNSDSGNDGGGDGGGGESVSEARTNPDQNTRYESGMKELIANYKDISDIENWAVSMTAEPKLGINPQVGISEDTPKGIYFYPLDYAVDLARRGKKLPWGDNMPYIQLFQYDRSGEMTKETQVDPARLKQALGQYCPAELIQQVIDEPDSLYDNTPYWFIYDCLSRLGKSDETNIVRWNKVLRDLGFTSVFDPGAGWIAYGEPTQGVVLDPRIIKQHKTISNKKQSKVVTPAVIEQAIFDTLDIELAANRAWQAYDPDGSKLRQAAKEYAKKPEFKQWFGKPGSEEIFDKAASWGRYGARELSQTAWVWYKEQQAQQPVTQGVAENFADGRNPQDKGDAKRHGVPTKASVSTLRKVAKQGGRKGQLAHWMANMKAGHKK